MAALSFLNANGQPAMFLDLLFIGDRFPDGRRCPRTKAEWQELKEADRGASSRGSSWTRSRPFWICSSSSRSCQSPVQ